MPRLLIELLLIEVVLLLELLGQAPDHVIFEFHKLSLLLIMFEQDLTLSELTGQIVREDIDFNFELFGYRVFDVFV